jgi:flagellar M-ring protein FliF
VSSTDPTTGLPLAASGSSSYQKKSETSTVVPSEQLDETEKATGTVTRQSVAVVLDTGAKNLPPNAQVQQLVAAALGLDPKRGDTIVVSSSSFDTSAQTPAPAAKSSMFAGKNLQTIVAGIMLLLITLLLVRSARKPKVQALAVPDVLPALSSGSREHAALPAGGRTALSAVPEPRTEDASVDLLNAVESQPDDVAHLLRGWLTESDGAGSR